MTARSERFSVQLVKEAQPVRWLAPRRLPMEAAVSACRQPTDVPLRAAEDFRRWAPLLAALFPSMAGGAVESPVVRCEGEAGLWLKMDCCLPVTGSVKTRGGFYEVLRHAERAALESGLVAGTALELAGAEARAVFSSRRLAVGSTGNLGLSVGSIGTALGFQTTVHMSRNAKAWKKELLRRRGAEVVEHDGPYSQAVAQGRAACQGDPMAHFVDDENSPLLFAGYSAAGPETARQLAAEGIAFSADRPLNVFLPCGVGGAPAGVAFGLACALGSGVRFWLVEPVQFPCVLAGLLTGAPFPVTDWGLGGQTEADGLAVGTASALALRVLEPLVYGALTVRSENMIDWSRRLRRRGVKAEPSAAAALAGWEAAGRPTPALAWLTGGSLVPSDVFDQILGVS